MIDDDTHGPCNAGGVASLLENYWSSSARLARANTHRPLQTPIR